MTAETLPTDDEWADYDWSAVLLGGDGYSGTFVARPGGNGDHVEDVTAERIAEVLGFNVSRTEGYAQCDVVALVLLTDGTHAALTAWCDTTGWDCQSDAQWRHAASKDEVIRHGLDDASRDRLGLVLPS